jgi:hypothetical protein
MLADSPRVFSRNASLDDISPRDAIEYSNSKRDAAKHTKNGGPKRPNFYHEMGQRVVGMQGVGTPPPPSKVALVSDVGFIEAAEQRLRSANTAIAIRIFMVKAPSGPC